MRSKFATLLIVGTALCAPFSHAAEKPAAAELEAGKELFEAAGSCSACHQVDGKGMPGSIPPLAKSGWVNDKNKERMIAITLKGLEGPILVDGVKYNSIMPPQLLFNSEQLSKILTYVQNSWGNEGGVITAAQVDAVRKKVADPSSEDFASVFTPEDLLKEYPFERQKGKKGPANGTFTVTYEDTVGDPKEPVVWRTFMPGASPAAFAIALPGKQYLCWDAGECRLRYVWTKGGFIQNNKRHWESNGKPVADFFGQPYYQARSSLLKPENEKDLARTNLGNPFYDTEQAADFPFRFGSEAAPKPRFRGYRLVDGYPEFLYTAEGTDISELYSVTEDKTGIIRHFKVSGVKDKVKLLLTPSDTATITASAGDLADDGVLTLTPEQASDFTVTIKEKPQVPSSK